MDHGMPYVAVVPQNASSRWLIILAVVKKKIPSDFYSVWDRMKGGECRTGHEKDLGRPGLLTLVKRTPWNLTF
jgi:hypothetical protein